MNDRAGNLTSNESGGSFAASNLLDTNIAERERVDSLLATEKSKKSKKPVY